MSFICEDNITMNPTTDTIIYEQEDVFKYIKKPDLDDCYICLSVITNKPESSAVFVFKCRHPICYDCLVDVSSKYAEDYIKHKMLCGICRSGTNRYLFNNKKLHKISYSETQSIMIPSNLITEQNIYSDHIQRLIAYSSIY